MQLRACVNDTLPSVAPDATLDLSDAEPLPLLSFVTTSSVVVSATCGSDGGCEDLHRHVRVSVTLLDSSGMCLAEAMSM
jgi:hypothetical protein